MTEFSTPQQITLPLETEKIALNIERLQLNDSLIRIAGWAYIPGQTTKGDIIYLVFESQQQTYFIDAFPVPRT